MVILKYNEEKCDLSCRMTTNCARRPGVVGVADNGEGAGVSKESATPENDGETEVVAV